MAASIPILRVLVKDVKKSIFSRRQYYGASGEETSNSKTTRKMQTSHNTHRATVAASNGRSRPTSEGTDGSELEILNNGVSSSKEGGIVQTHHYTVEYEKREWRGTHAV